MQNIEQTVDLIRTLAWTLSVASAQNKLDVPGEYVWAFPDNLRFWAVRDRYRSIFSSGNSIKDPEVIDFIQSTNINHYLLDPWITAKFEEQFVSWIQTSSRYSLRNLDLFTYTGYSQGTQEAFLNFYIMNKDKRFRVFRGDYWWHMDIWTKAGFRWAYLEDDDVRPGDVCICSYPFALTGRKHQEFDQLVDICNRSGVELMVDFIYLPNSNHEVDIDLAADCIRTITFSFSKTFPVQCAKIAVRMCKNKPQDPMQMSNDENILNRLASGLAVEIMQQFAPDHMVIKYQHKQRYWCDRLGLESTPVVHFALGPNYTAWGRQEQLNWCSPFNEQQNRYNLGMLFENEGLLRSVGLCDCVPGFGDNQPFQDPACQSDLSSGSDLTVSDR